MTEQNQPPEPGPPTRREKFRAFVTNPLFAPSMTIIILAVGLSNLGIGAARYLRQGWRWAAEDPDRVQGAIGLDSSLFEGKTRWGNVVFYTGREPMRITGVKIVDPPDQK